MPTVSASNVAAQTSPVMDMTREAFRLFELQLEGLTAGSIHERRRAAMERWLAAGVPTTRQESWKYTSLKEVMHPGLMLEPMSRGLSQTNLPWLRRSFAQGMRANVLCTVNGRYEPAASTIYTPIHEAEMLGTAQAERKNSRTMDAHFGRLAEGKDNALVDLNTALTAHGVLIRVPEGKQVELPIILYHLANATAHAPLAQPRVLVVLGAGASLTLVEAFDSTGEEPSLTNSVMEVVLGERATLKLTKLQFGGPNASLIDSTFIEQAANSLSETVTITTGGRLVRNNLTVALAGEQSHAALSALYQTDTNRHVDSQTTVKHLVPNCTSDELYKGIGSGRGSAAFNGRIYVAPDAQKTNAFQSNRNLLLSEDATMNTKPQLEIYADDVRCTHGATVGQLSEEAMFYLRSRGIGSQEAQMLLIGAFAGQVLERIPLEPVRVYAEKLAQLS